MATSLPFAVYYGDIKSVQYLLAVGGKTALDKPWGACAEAFIGYDWEQFFTPLFIAVYRGNTEMVEELLKAGSAVNQELAASEGVRGRTPLFCCVSSEMPKYLEMVRLLLEHGADPNIRPDDSWSILSSAISRHNVVLVEFLIAKGADPSLRDPSGDTPLQKALMEDLGLGTIARLLDAGAPVNAANQWGFHPLDYARQYDVQQLLKKHGAVHGKMIIKPFD